MTRLESWTRVRVHILIQPAGRTARQPMRRTIMLAMALAGVISLSACGSSGSVSGTPTVTATEQAIQPIPIVTPTPGAPGTAGAGATTPAPGITPTPVPATNGQNGSYTVQQGDTLYEIAVKFNVTLQALMQANALTDASSIQAGQVLVIPPH